MGMRKTLFLSLAASICLCANDIYELDEIVTIGTKTKSSISDLPMQTTVITSEEIENSGSSNVGEILKDEGSIYLSTSGSNGATMSIRGMAHGDTLYLIDGRRITGEFSKTYELDRIPASMIERIEIVKGSSSLLYGSDAMGGVINIITKKPTKDFGGNAQLMHGKNKNDIDFFVHGAKEKFSYRLYANYLDRDAFTKKETTDVKVMQGGVEKSPSNLTGGGNWATLRSNLSDSYAVNHDYQGDLELKTIGGGVTYLFSDAFTLDVDMSYLKEDKHSDSISTIYQSNYTQNGNAIKVKYIPIEQMDDNERYTLDSSLSYHPNENFEVEYTFAYSRYEKSRKIYTSLWQELGYASKEDSLSSGNESTIEHINNDLLATYTFSETNRVLAGAEYRITDVESNAFSVDDRNYKALFVQHEYRPFEKIGLVYGARYDKDSIGESEISLSFGGTYDITQNTKIKANYSQGFRSPDDRELYVDQTSPSGKKMLGSTVIDAAVGKTTIWDLKPETSETIEAGFLTKGDIWNFEFTLFKTDIDDRITRIDYGSYMSFENISKSEIKGYESSFAIMPIDDLMIKATYSDIDAENKTDGTQLQYTPENLASLTLSYFLRSDLELRSITKYVGEQTNSDDEKIGGFGITNLKLIYTRASSNMSFFAGVDNVFDKNIPEDLGAIERSNYYIGMNYTF